LVFTVRYGLVYCAVRTSLLRGADLEFTARYGLRIY